MEYLGKYPFNNRKFENSSKFTSEDLLETSLKILWKKKLVIIPEISAISAKTTFKYAPFRIAFPGIHPRLCVEIPQVIPAEIHPKVSSEISRRTPNLTLILPNFSRDSF